MNLNRKLLLVGSLIIGIGYSIFILTQDTTEKTQRKDIAVIVPTFTKFAYSEYYGKEDEFYGFYSYFNKVCGEECLTVEMLHDIKHTFGSSNKGRMILTLLGHTMLTDIQVDKNPEILEKYDRIIILHNEYVTQKEYDAITSHPDVTYLYPNALYAEVKVDYEKNTISLVRGHGYKMDLYENYPESISAFGWKYDNSPEEWDRECLDWKFNDIPNGRMLNCYPEYIIFEDRKLLNEILVS